MKSSIFKLMLAGFAMVNASYPANQDCSNFNGEMGCSSGQITTNPADWAQRSFQTALPGDDYYKKGYEGLGRVMCYPEITYTSSARTSANVEVKCRQHSSITKVEYNFSNKGW